jgi:hypothetical protein
MGALVRTAVRQDAGDIVAPKNVEHALERIIRVGLLIVVQGFSPSFSKIIAIKQ